MCTEETMIYNKDLVLVRGGGDLATGTIHRLVQAGFSVVVLEIPQPTVIRHSVAFSQCIFTGQTEVEGVTAVMVTSPEDALQKITDEVVPVLVDPEGVSRSVLQPFAVVDAILAKRNTGITKAWAPIVIGLGPGFTAGEDVHAVVETNRGHNLGRVYYTGSAEPNTGIPGDIAGFSKERIVRAPENGSFTPVRAIGNNVMAGDLLGYVGDVFVYSPLTGMLRGLINEGVAVTRGMKIGDVDPRNIREHCWTISDKARAISGGVLEALLHLKKRLEARG
jgi:xanthine dehydrogenase accessory factor